jgi:hypothetical protein
MRWVEDNYLVRRTWDNQHIIYFGRTVNQADVPNARPIDFGAGVRLIGYAARPVVHDAPDAPATLETEVFWQAERAPARDYTVFVHLYDATGRLVASHDGQPVYGFLPTSQWPVGRIIVDRHDIALPADLAAGDYQLAAGLYDATTGERLSPVQTAGGPHGDRADLSTLTLPGQ